MSVVKNQQAPDFSLFADNKEPFRLSDHKGSNVLLLFFPGAFTTPCTAELNEVNGRLDTYRELNTRVVGISTDSPFALAAFKKQHSIGFPLLSDHNAQVCLLYGTKYGPGVFALGLHRISRRAAFVVDVSGIIRYAEVLENAGDNPDFEAIREILKALNNH